MSFSHPLLKNLKANVLQLRLNDESEVDDNHPLLLSLCVNLESLFRLGLKSLPSLVGVLKRDYWCWIDILAKSYPPKFSSKAIQMIDSVRNNPFVMTKQGKGRLIIRSCLSLAILSDIVEKFIKDATHISKMFYAESSCLGNEIFSEIMLSLLYELKNVTFNLNLQNCSFLDDSWLIPVYKEFTIEPCLKVGMNIEFCKERVFVVEMDEGCVAAEDDKISVGDVIVKVDDQCVSEYNRNKTIAAFKKCVDKPLKLSIVKVGTMCVIEGGIIDVVKERNKPQDVWLESKEMHLTVISCTTQKVLFNHNYSQVGSCGRRIDFPHHFCYVAGNVACNIAKDFCCYVFEGDSETEVKVILKLIAMGFQRTHWTV